MGEGEPRESKQSEALRIGAMLIVDLVGYSRQPTRVGTAWIESLTKLVSECPTYIEASKSGAIIKSPTGDGFLLTFTLDMAAPARCALELSERVNALGEFQLRFGIHVGPYDPTVDLAGNPNVAGEGPNVAARAMASAPPGDIHLTDRAREFLRELPETRDSLIPLGATIAKHGMSLGLWRLADPFSPERRNRAERFLNAAARVSGRIKNAAPRGTIAERMRQLRRDTWLGFASIVVLVILLTFAGSQDWGKRAELAVYQRLQSLIPGPNSPVPITVVDIGSISNGSSFEKDAAGTTDMRQLGLLLEKVLALKPRAVAIDIDFGRREEDPRLNPTNPVARFFPDRNGDVTGRALKSFLAGRPVYLAVLQGLHRMDPESWLGSEELVDLIAHPLAPEPSLDGQITMVEYIQIPVLDEDGRPTTPKVIPSIAKVLADSLSNSAMAPAPPERLVERFAAPTEERRNVMGVSLPTIGRTYYLNVAAFERIKRDTIHVKSPADLANNPEAAKRITGSVVLIGSASDKQDQHPMPGIGPKEAGIYFHALGAYTRGVAPLYVFRPWFRVTLVTGMCALVLGTVLWVRRRYIAVERDVAASRLSLFAIVLLTLLMIMVGLWLVRTYGVLWTDFLYTSLILLFHPQVEQAMVRGWSAVGRLTQWTGDRVVFSSTR